jgi:hypothetical protein
VHVVEAQSVRGVASYRRRESGWIIGADREVLNVMEFALPRNVDCASKGRHLSWIVRVAIERLTSSTIGVFPLCLSRKTIAFPLPSAEPANERQRVVVRDIDDRILVRLRVDCTSPIEVRATPFALGDVGAVTPTATSILFGFGLVTGLVDELAELPNGYFELSEKEWAGDADPVPSLTVL